MGCLKKLTKMVIFIALLFAFFAYGGYTFVKNKYDSYTKPERSVLISEEKDFGNLKNVSADYILTRSLNFFGYRKLNATYIPKNQKISVFDLNSKEILNEKDFSNGKIEEKFEKLSNKFFNSPVLPLSNIELMEQGKILAGSKYVPYANFEADFKYIPFLKLNGTIAVYETKNRENLVNKVKEQIQNSDNITSKLVLSTKIQSDYDSAPTKKFISSIKL